MIDGDYSHGKLPSDIYKEMMFKVKKDTNEKCQNVIKSFLKLDLLSDDDKEFLIEMK